MIQEFNFKLTDFEIKCSLLKDFLTKESAEIQKEFHLNLHGYNQYLLKSNNSHFDCLKKDINSYEIFHTNIAESAFNQTIILNKKIETIYSEYSSLLDIKADSLRERSTLMLLIKPFSENPLSFWKNEVITYSELDLYTRLSILYKKDLIKNYDFLIKLYKELGNVYPHFNLNMKDLLEYNDSIKVKKVA